MELTGDIFIDATCEQVWGALNDPKVLTLAIPGCEEVRQISPVETHVRVLIKMGPVRARFVGKIMMSEVRPGEGCLLTFEGAGGAAGFAKGSSTVSLSAEGSGTRLRYTAQASVGGKLGQIGGRMIDASAKQTADLFFLALKQQLLGVSPQADVCEASSPDVAALPSVASATRLGASQAGPGEAVRVLWFVLGAAATGFGFWVASVLTH
jgi:hypothetical protein